MKSWIKCFAREIKINPTVKSKTIVFLYRLSSVFFSKKKNPLKYIFIIFVILYYFLVEIVWGVEIKPKTKIGWGMRIFHPTGIIINPGSIIGKNLILRQGITIGNKFNKYTGEESNCPIIGDDVEFGAHCTIIGDIRVGDNVLLGAMSFVDFNVPDSAIIAAPRAILLRIRDDQKEC